MRTRITYQPGSSLLHALHPLVKAAWLVAGTVFVFAVRSPWVVRATVAALLITFQASGLRLSKIRGTRLFIMTALALGLLQLLFIDDGKALLTCGPLRLTAGGLESGIYVASRFLSVILLSYLFVLTTEPNVIHSHSPTVTVRGFPFSSHVIRSDFTSFGAASPPKA